MYQITEEQKTLMQNAFQMIKDGCVGAPSADDLARFASMSGEQITVLESLPAQEEKKR